MKSVQPVCFAIGTAGIFAIGLAMPAGGIAALPPEHAPPTALAAALILGAMLAWLSQFRRRYAGPTWLLAGFAAAGLSSLLLTALRLHGTWAGPVSAACHALAGMTAIVLLWKLAVRTRAASEHGQAAP